MCPMAKISMAAPLCLEAVRAAALLEAETWIGTPYRHQGARKHVGCDCLGLVRGVWRGLYGADPGPVASYAADWSVRDDEDRLLVAARHFCVELPVAEAEPGDILMFRWRPHLAARHLAILAGREHIIHAYEGHAVCRSAFVPQWRRRVAAAFHFPILKEQDI